jgi:hypothetical protein
VIDATGQVAIVLIKVNGVQGSSSLNVGPTLLVGCFSLYFLQWPLRVVDPLTS